MLYDILIPVVVLSTVIALFLAIVQWAIGSNGVEYFLNKFAGRRTTLIAVQTVVAVVILSWVALVIPFIDLTTFQMHAHFEGRDGFISYLGLIAGKEGNFYYGVLFTGTLAVKAGLKIWDMANLLKSGPVTYKKHGFLQIWHPAH